MKYSGRHISDEELDQLFRDAHASVGQEALFVTEFWSEMEAMLPAEKKRKRGLYWIPVAAAVILIGMILFYPSSPAKIEQFAQKQNENITSLKLHSVNESENEQNSGTLHTQTYTSQNEGNISSPDNRQIQNTEFDVKSTFRNQRRINSNRALKIKSSPGLDDRGSFARTDKNKTPDNAVVILNPEVNSDPHSELDSINLEKRYEHVPHEEIADLPKKTSNESNEWYVELGPTVGQSPYLSPEQKRNVVAGAVLGGGYTKRIDNAFVSFGLQARMEGFGGLEYRETNFSPNIVRTVSVKQLYSLEVPLRFGYTFRRSELSFGVTPGIQLFIHGKERITENQIVQREDSFTGKVEHSNSMTMECGFQYYYNFSPRWGIGAKINADILRPFHTDYYLGKSTGLPVNGQIVLRRSFLN